MSTAWLCAQNQPEADKEKYATVQTLGVDCRLLLLTVRARLRVSISEVNLHRPFTSNLSERGGE